MIKTIIPKIVI